MLISVWLPPAWTSSLPRLFNQSNWRPNRWFVPRLPHQIDFTGVSAEYSPVLHLNRNVPALFHDPAVDTAAIWSIFERFRCKERKRNEVCIFLCSALICAFRLLSLGLLSDLELEKDWFGYFLLPVFFFLFRFDPIFLFLLSTSLKTVCKLASMSVPLAFLFWCWTRLSGTFC